jgi:dolichol-phosphate mannosyltransferase
MSFSPKQGVSVIIAVYNEVENIEPLLNEIFTALHNSAVFEIVAVDDFSSDGTREQLSQLQTQLPYLRVVNHDRNYGQSIAVINGVRAARHNWILTLDGDGQNDPNDFSKLFAAVENIKTDQPVLAAGIRVDRRDSALRRWSSQIANRIRGSLLKDNCPDSACGLKLFQRKVFLQLPHFNHLHRFLPALFKRAGGTIINVEVNHRPRLHGHSKYGTLNRLCVGISDLLGVMWLIRRPCPLESQNVTSS